MGKRRADKQEKRAAPIEASTDRFRRDVDVDHLMRADSADAFIRHPDDGPVRVDDDLAETLAEEFVHAATSGGDQDEDAQDQMVPEEIGGPFVETSASEEFADGVDESNPEDAEKEPIPRAMSGHSDRPPEEE
jgi:hypothetical protein